MKDRKASGPVHLLDVLVSELADADCDFDVLDETVQQVKAVWEPRLVPRLERALTAAVDARDWYARHVLAMLLADVAGRGALPELLGAWCRDLGDDQDSLTAVIVELSREDPPTARRIVVPWLGASDPSLRKTAAWLLGFVPLPGDAELLCPAAGDPDESVRSAVAGSLTGQGPAGVALLVRLLDDPAAGVRISALSSLGFARDPQSLAAIRRLADDADPRVRAWVGIAMSRFPVAELADDAANFAVLRRLAQDSDAYAREQVASHPLLSGR